METLSCITDSIYSVISLCNVNMCIINLGNKTRSSKQVKGDKKDPAPQKLVSVSQSKLVLVFCYL